MSESENPQRRNFVADGSFILGARDLGLTTTNAVCELTDNSIDADADNIHIKVEKNTVEENGQEQKYLRIYVEDDGHGIARTIIDDEDGVEYDGLTYALAFGGRHRNNKSKIGKFGWGLSASATCQSKRTEVYTRTPDEDGWRHTYVDLDEMDEHGDTRPPAAENKELPKHLDLENRNKDSGTIIVFEKCDDPQRATANGMESHLTGEISRIYRRFLDAGKTITINGIELAPKDPLYMMDGCYNPYEIPLVDDPYHEETIMVEAPEEDAEGKYEVTLRVVWLDVEAIRTKDEWSGDWMSEVGLIEDNQGFSLVRNGREITNGVNFGLFSPHADKNYMRAEIEFPSELDKRFGIQTDKSRVSLKEPMKDKLSAALGGTTTQIQRRTRERITKLKAEQDKNKDESEPSTSEEAAEKADKYLKSRQKLSDDEEDQIEQEIEEEKEERIKEIEERDDLDEDEKEEVIEREERRYERRKSSSSFNITTETLGSGKFYEADIRGKQANAIINDGHDFHEAYRRVKSGDAGVFGEEMDEGMNLREIQAEASILVDLLLLSASHAELRMQEEFGRADEAVRYIDRFQDEWSTALRLFLEHKPEAENEKLTSMSADD